MKDVMMKKIFLLPPPLILAVLLLAGCIDDKPDAGTNPSGGGEWNDFPFTTAAVTELSIDYAAPASVYFEVYDQNPVTENETGTAYVKKEGIEPLYAGVTDDRGRFTKRVSLPTYLEKAYLYTPNMYARTLLVATRENGILTASDAVSPETASFASGTRATYESAVIASGEWKNWLGSYDNSTGKISYAYTGSTLREKNYEEVYKATTSVFNINKSCPKEYRSSNDLYLEKDAEVAVTFLASNTCWNCSMGYYYYDASTPPSSLKDVNVILIFPNTQDGKWSLRTERELRKYIGVERGTSVQLKYYPNIASGSREGETTVFPKGYRIGFALATNAWSNRISGFGGTKTYRAATSAGLSINDKGQPYQEPRTAVYRYANASKGINSVVFSFEDYTTDENFSDIIFTMKSNPVEAVVDIPSVDVKPGAETEVKLLKGIYAFEDLWPSRGDYDMNDVMVKLNYEKKFTQAGITSEAYLLKTYNNYAGYDNGLAVTLCGASVSADLSVSILRPSATEYEPYTEFKREGKVLLLTENVKTDIGATYRIEAAYASPQTEENTGLILPFIFNTTRTELTPGKRWEVHIPYEAPTDKIESSYFGQGDDRSDPASGRYYVRAENYPFAFFLSGATDADLSGLLDPKNEKTPIDQLFPGYLDWAASKGTVNTDWYKKK